MAVKFDEQSHGLGINKIKHIWEKKRRFNDFSVNACTTVETFLGTKVTWNWYRGTVFGAPKGLRSRATQKVS